MKDKNRKKIERRQTPVSDGDTRPDTQPSGKNSTPPNLDQDEKVTKERGADVNSLEDYKDAK